MVLGKSKIFLYFCLSFVFGVALASFVNIPQSVSGIFLIGAIVIITMWWQKQWPLVVLGFCIIFAVAGVWRFQDKSKISDNDISKFNEKGRVIFSGIVDKEPDNRIDKQMIVVRAAENCSPPLTENENSSLSGRVLLAVDKYPEYQYGDQLEIAGFLKKPQNYSSFNYQEYLAKDDIYSVAYYPEIKILARNQGSIIKSYLFKIKRSFERNLSKILPEPQTSLANGLILGERATLPNDLINIFNLVGITHIIALSGFNITIISDNLRRFFNNLMISRRFSFWLTIILIFAFVIMTGASASIIRAAVMGVLLILAQRTGRLYSSRNALVFAGVVMIFHNPKIFRFDLGFQLSFLATLGLIYMAPFFEKYLQWLPKSFDLRGIAGATLAAQIAVLPLIMYSFGRLSLIAPIANLLILPLIPLTMFFGFFAGTISWLWLGLGKIIGFVAWLFLSYQIKIAELMAKIPLASLDVKIGWGWLAAMYIALWGGAAFLIQKSRRCQPALR